MQAGILFLGLIVLFLIIGACLGWVAATKTARIDRTLHDIESRLKGLDRRVQKLSMPPAAPAQEVTAQETPAETGAAPEHEQTSAAPAARTQLPSVPQPYADVPADNFIDRVVENMRHNWMAWLGGLSVALAGIFLVGYSIERGWLGPTARILLAIVTGLVLHAAAEYFRRKTKTAHPAFAALAGGASITLYAALFAALELYELLSPGMTFTLLAVVSLGTMALATVHGPTLAIIGLLGAYAVPVLVTEHAGGRLIELVYSLIVTAAALYLIRFVYRPWLWFGMLAGVIGWWFLSLPSADADGWRGLYLAAFCLLALTIPYRDATLKRELESSDPATETLRLSGKRSVQVIQLTVVLIVLAQALSIANLGFTGVGPALVTWTPLTLILLYASRARASLGFAPWLVLITQLAAWLFTALDRPTAGIRIAGLADELQGEFLAFAFFMALLFSLGSSFAHRARRFNHLDASLTWLSPVLWLALSYLLVTDLSVAWEWSVATLVLGLVYVFIAGRRLNRQADDASALWLILGGHAAYSLAAAMFFREATLTLALAAQVVSLAWLNRRFSLAAIGWIIKGVLAIVVARLTLNPWLLTYPADVHWSLWTYGGSVLCCLIGTMLTPVSSLETRKWLEAATLHLLVLFLGAELRYVLYDGRIFVEDFTLTEAAINTVIWGGIGLSYYNRRRASELLAHFYVVCSRILLTMSLASYAISLVFLNPAWSRETVGTTPILNLLLLAYGAPVLIALAVRLFYEPRYRDLAAVIAGAGCFVFVTLEIRHLWHGALDLDLGTTNGEVYTYSAAWLAMAVATMLGATKLGSTNGYRAGMGLLLVVIGKIFIFDMAGLEGLLRVASFMGLGLALLGLAWLYQRTAQRAA